MAKTYNTLGTVAPGDVLRANSGTAAYNNIIGNVNNHRVPPMAEVRRTTTQSIANTTWANVSFDASAAIFDTDSMWDSANPTYLTIKTAGVYLFSVQASFATNGSGARLVDIEKNAASPGAVGSYFAYMNVLPQTVSDQAFAISAIESCSVNDVITVSVYQSSGGALNLSTNPYQALRAVWLGQAS
jgi:hypothetical protein